MPIDRLGLLKVNMLQMNVERPKQKHVRFSHFAALPAAAYLPLRADRAFRLGSLGLRTQKPNS